MTIYTLDLATRAHKTVTSVTTDRSSHFKFFHGKNQGALLSSLSLVKGAMGSRQMLTTDA